MKTRHIIALLFLILISFLFGTCRKNEIELSEEIQFDEPDLQVKSIAENFKEFKNLTWNFNLTQDTFINRIVGLWLSTSVTYNDEHCADCDSLFAWAIESSGKMTKRNNYYGSYEDITGNWKYDSKAENIIFSWNLRTVGSNSSFKTVVDTINFELVSDLELKTNQLNSDSTKLSIDFQKVNL